MKKDELRNLEKSLNRAKLIIETFNRDYAEKNLELMRFDDFIECIQRMFEYIVTAETTIRLGLNRREKLRARLNVRDKDSLTNELVTLIDRTNNVKERIFSRFKYIFEREFTSQTASANNANVYFDPAKVVKECFDQMIANLEFQTEADVMSIHHKLRNLSIRTAQAEFCLEYVDFVSMLCQNYTNDYLYQHRGNCKKFKSDVVKALETFKKLKSQCEEYLHIEILVEETKKIFKLLGAKDSEVEKFSTDIDSLVAIVGNKEAIERNDFDANRIFKAIKLVNQANAKKKRNINTELAVSVVLAGTVAGLAIYDVYQSAGPATELGELLKSVGVEGLGSSINTGLTVIGSASALIAIIGAVICCSVNANLSKKAIKESLEAIKLESNSSTHCER